jgi:hypothetical protein
MLSPDPGEAESKLCFCALSDFKTDPEILTRPTVTRFRAADRQTPPHGLGAAPENSLQHGCPQSMKASNVEESETRTMIIYTESKINRKNGHQVASESVTWGVWHSVAQHFQNAAQRSAKLLGNRF